ncbi:MAG: hypothetical protein FWD87_02025 [Spirochaetaceae bacterium]|nr:hypothetical protein [Spirochaetaceae bacterium]
MKNTFKLIGIIAFAAIIGFSMVGCGDDDDKGTPDLKGSIAVTPTSAGMGTELAATYSGSETVTYQWKRGATNVGTNSNKFMPTEAGDYTVTVSATGYNSKTSSVVNVDPSRLRLSNLPIEFLDETDITDFSFFWLEGFYQLSDVITGTPKVQITGAGSNRRLTIELDQPEADWMFEYGPTYATPSDAKILDINGFWESTQWYVLCMLGSDSEGDIYTFLFYADKDVVLNYDEGHWRFNNVSLKRGWNFVSATYPGYYLFYAASQTQPADAVWKVLLD